MSTHKPFVLLSLLLAVGLAACRQASVPMAATPSPTAATAATATAVPGERFKIVGYVTGNVIVEQVPFARLTHINYAFVIPNADGTLKPIANSWKLDQLVREAHAQGVNVLIAVGGWGHDETFEALAADPQARQTLVAELVAFVEKHNLDGVDMDWEYPDPATMAPDSAQNFVHLMQALGAEMRARRKLLTAAVVALGPYGEGVDTAVFAEVDFLNLMAYDKGEGHHSPLQYAQESLAYWQGRGLPPAKTVLGVPFYGRQPYTTYRELVEADAAAAYQDESERFGSAIQYNGIPTIQQKTQLALDQASGIMIWTLTDDTQDETSLLQAIYQTAYGEN